MTFSSSPRRATWPSSFPELLSFQLPPRRRLHRTPSLLKSIRVFSNFVAFISIRWKSQMWAHFPGVDFLGIASNFIKFRKRKKISPQSLTSLVFVLHETWNFKTLSKRSQQLAAATLGKLTGLIFEIPGKKFFKTVTCLKEFNGRLIFLLLANSCQHCSVLLDMTCLVPRPHYSARPKRKNNRMRFICFVSLLRIFIWTYLF